MQNRRTKGFSNGETTTVQELEVCFSPGTPHREIQAVRESMEIIDHILSGSGNFDDVVPKLLQMTLETRIVPVEEMERCTDAHQSIQNHVEAKTPRIP